MSAFHETIKQILADVDRFLKITLKDESLSKSAQKEKSKILNSFQKLYEEYEVLNPNNEEGSSSSSKGVPDESRFTTTSTHSHGSHGSHGSEEESYTDNIPFTTVKALTEPLKIGYLQKKPTEFLEKFSKQKKYCVVHKNIMYWFKKPSDKNQQAAIFLLGYEFKDLTQNDKEFVFELVSEKKKSILFQADSKEDLDEWKKAIETSISFSKLLQPKPKMDESITIEESYEEEYEDIGEIANAVRSAANAAPKIAASAAKLPSQPSLPPQPSQDVYADAESMLPPSEDDDNDSIYEFVGQEDTNNVLKKSAPAQELRSSVPMHQPPRPPVSQEPPPLPQRGVGIPLPNSSAPVVDKRCPALDKTSLLEDYENLFYGIWSCISGSADGLSFDRGDIVHVLNRDLDSEGWWIGERDGNIGLVPKAFLSPAYQAVVA